jgi:O-antigen ligase
MNTIAKNNLNRKCLSFFGTNLLLVAASLLFDFEFAGFTFLGYLWVIMFLFSALVIFTNRAIRFPYQAWLPFFIYFTARLVGDFSFVGLQQTLQYFAPLLAGMAASGFIYTRETLYRILQYFRAFGIFLIIYTILYPLIMGKNFGAGAQLVMTVTLTVAILFSAYLFYKNQKDLILTVLLLLVPFLSTLRMGMLMTLLVIPLNFARTGIRVRIITSVVILVAALLIFSSPGFQRKMFFSGTGRLSDISFDNPDFYTSGRKYLYGLLEEGIREHPIFGNGPRADLQEFKKAGIQIRETHNDYKAVQFNYGLVGLFTLLYGFILTFYKIFRKKPGPGMPTLVNLFRSSALTLFLPFFGYMYTDNILKYTIFFGTLHFAFMAIMFSEFREASPDQ